MTLDLHITGGWLMALCVVGLIITALRS